MRGDSLKQRRDGNEVQRLSETQTKAWMDMENEKESGGRVEDSGHDGQPG